MRPVTRLRAPQRVEVDKYDAEDELLELYAPVLAVAVTSTCIPGYVGTDEAQRYRDEIRALAVQIGRARGDVTVYSPFLGIEVSAVGDWRHAS